MEFPAICFMGFTSSEDYALKEMRDLKEMKGWMSSEIENRRPPAIPHHPVDNASLPLHRLTRSPSSPPPTPPTSTSPTKFFLLILVWEF